MDFEKADAVTADFARSHEYLSTSAESTFVRFLTAGRRDATGTDKLISCTLRRIDGSGVSERTLAGREEWLAALAGVFGLTLDDLDRDDRDRLYRRARAAQDEWDREREQGGGG
jgi:arylamine N-acetyltransferase